MEEMVTVMMNNIDNQDVNNAIELLRKSEIQSEKGLPENLFLLVSALVPLPNIDMLIVNEKGQILLTRRNDEFFQKSWHIPGGCMRYGETMENRIHETAKRELGTDVSFDAEPIAIRDVIRGHNIQQKYKRERGHNIAVLYRCYLPKGYQINNGNKVETEDGFIKWFDKLPDDFMKIQHVYDSVLERWI